VESQDKVSLLSVHSDYLERFFVSAKASAVIGVVGSTCTIVFGFRQDWQLAVAVILSTITLILAGAVLRFYSRQVRARYQAACEQMAASADESKRTYLDCVEALHLFVHNVRDEVAHIHSRMGDLLDHLEQKPDWQQFVAEFLRMRDNSLQLVLNDLLRVFVPLLPSGARPWAAIRVLTKISGGVGIYETRLRVGSVNPDRHVNSQGIREDEGLPAYLREQHRLGRGIIILGPERPPEIWEPMRNDMRAEDSNIIVGPVFLKSIQPWAMAMILYVNSPDKNVFSDHHIPFMKCCTDTLSMWLFAITALCPSVNMTEEAGSKG
jgi:hypothetical protein